MKKFAKRGISLLMALAMCLSILCGIDLTADAVTVDYVYAGDYIKNWGVRGTTATFLSQNAEAFYEDNNTSYEELATLSGASDTADVPSSALFDELHTLMFQNIDLWTSYSSNYDAGKTLYQYTDCQNSGKTSAKISSFYSGTEIGPAWNSSEWNREHTWPNSKGTGASKTEALREADIMMLRPTSVSENSGRGNNAYGQSSGFYNPNSASNGAYDLRGDVARIVLYVYTCWGGHSNSTYHNGALDYMWGSSGVIESKEVLLSWMEADPVDTWELGRNDSVESITGTRNVFVDYPELAFLLFNEDIPTDYTTPSGNAASSDYQITAVSANTAYGTVTVNGKIITASPKTGYYAAGCTVVSGDAAVLQNGNIFTVTTTSDCTIRIDFAAKTAATVTYSQNAQVAGVTTGLYVGDAAILPDHSGAAPEGCTFMGWVTATVAETGTQPTTIYLPGVEYNTTAADTVFYALYSYVGEGDGSGSGQWTAVTSTSQLTAGTKLVLANKSKGVIAGGISGSNTYMSKVDATFSDNTIPALPSDAQILVLGGSSGAWTLADESGKLLGATAVKKVAWGNGTATWTISVDSAGSATIQSTTSSYGRFLYNNNAPRFTTYTSDATAAMLLPQLYMLDEGGGMTLYSTNIGTEPECYHTNAHNVGAVAPECDFVGYTAGVYCPDCDAYLSGHEEIPAINHEQAYEETGEAPTCTEAGYEDRLYCPDCDEYLEEQVILPATGHSYVNGVCSVCGASEYDVLILTEDTEITLSLTEDLYVDLAGFRLSGTITTNGYKVCGMDSTTDGYTCENIGCFTCVDENGEPIRPERICAYGEKQYLAICEEERYSFHRFFVGITHMSLEPEVVGLGYKSVIFGDEMVFTQLAATKAFSFRVQLEGYGPVYRHFDSEELASGDPITLRIRNYDVENYSETNLYAQVSLTFSDGTVVETGEAALTFRWLTEQVNANYTDYTNDQITQFKAMLQQFDIVKKWDIPNLL